MRAFAESAVTIRRIFGSLFSFHYVKRRLCRRLIGKRKYTFVFRRVIILLRQEKRVAKRVEFIFAFPHPRAVCVANIAYVPFAVRLGVKRICVRIKRNKPKLPLGKTAYKLRRFFTFRGIRNILQNLRRAVAKPHGGNIARDYERQSLRLGKRGIDRGKETFEKHFAQAGIADMLGEFPHRFAHFV